MRNPSIYNISRWNSHRVEAGRSVNCEDNYQQSPVKRPSFPRGACATCSASKDVAPSVLDFDNSVYTYLQTRLLNYPITSLHFKLYASSFEATTSTPTIAFCSYNRVRDLYEFGQWLCIRLSCRSCQSEPHASGPLDVYNISKFEWAGTNFLTLVTSANCSTKSNASARNTIIPSPELEDYIMMSLIHLGKETRWRAYLLI